MANIVDDRATERSRFSIGLDKVLKWVKPDYAIAALVFVAVSTLLIDLKLIRVDQQYGDTAILSQVVENIANRGVPMSGVMANILGFLSSGFPVMTVDQVVHSKLAPPAVPEINHLQFHMYVILYPIALLVKFLPTDFVLMSIYVLSFTTFVLIAYIALRAAGVSILASFLFCLLIVSHPAWSEGLRWQFYPDRIFLTAGLLFMLLTSSARAPKSLQIAAALFCWSIDERASITAGLFLLSYVALYWRKSNHDRYFRLCLGAVLVLAGLITIKFFLPMNIYNGSFLPTSIGSLIALFKDPVTDQRIGIFFLFNGVLWLLAWFEWRAALIALLLMLPNIVGSIGGAEKTGWATHYHDEYLPGLIWAAMVGFVAAYRKVPRYRTPVVAVGLAILMALLVFRNPATGKLAETNLQNTFILWFPREVRFYSTPAGMQSDLWAKELKQVVPEGSVVSTIEVGMPFLYHNRTVRMFPMDIDHADYAVLVHSGEGDGDGAYSGAVNFRGPEVSKEVNVAIVRRMRRDGYDFDHPKLVGPGGLIVVQRLHGS